MSSQSTIVATPSACSRCSAPLAPNALECSKCGSLVHAAELTSLSERARELEAANKFKEAIALWDSALRLLPYTTKQAEWIRAHQIELDQRTASQVTEQPSNPWVKRLGPLAPVALLLTKAKSLLLIFKAPFLLSLFAFLGFYWAEFGIWFGVGFAALILIHEMGHFIDIKRRGLSADMPIFLPGLGAFVRWKSQGVSLRTRAAVSLAGPLAGFFAAAGCAVAWKMTGNPLWAALARTSAWLNLLNLIPVWLLDGGQAMYAITRNQRIALLTLTIGLWLFLHESILFLVALGMGWRLFTKDTPPEESLATAFYFGAVLCALAVLMQMMPGKGAGLP